MLQIHHSRSKVGSELHNLYVLVSTPLWRFFSLTADHQEDYVLRKLFFYLRLIKERLGENCLTASSKIS